jgi:hypothetical protein
MRRLGLVACVLIVLFGCDEPEKKKESSATEPESSDRPDSDSRASEEEESDEPSDADEDSGQDDEEEVLDAGSSLDAVGEQDSGSDAESDAGVAPSADAGSDASSVLSSDAAADAGNTLMPNWGDQPCDKASSKPGCKDKALALCVCRGPAAEGGNNFCCTERWSYLCVDGATSLPECKFVTNKCCEAHPADGCETPQVEQCVCDEVQRMKRVEMEAGRNPASVHDCCHDGWSAFCAILAAGVCGATCS